MITVKQTTKKLIILIFYFTAYLHISKICCSCQHYPILFVSSNGTDLNNFNCSQQYPCGTLFHASYIRENTDFFKQLNTVEIRVYGIHSSEIDYTKDILIYITMPLIITFEEITFIEILRLYKYYTSASSTWIYHKQPNSIPYAIKGGMKSNDDALVINNLIIKDAGILYNSAVVYAFVHLDSGTLILNHSIFDSIKLWSLEYTFTVPNIEIYNSIFNNIYIGDTWDDDWLNPVSMHGFIYVNSGYFIMKNCSVFGLDFWWTHFVYADDISYGVVENCFFDNEFGRFDETYSLIYFQKGSANNNGQPAVYINDSTFMHCINVLHLGKGCDLSVSVHNVLITTSHLSSADLINNAKALIMVSETAKLTMNNVNLTYQWMSDINDYCGWDGTYSHWYYDLGNHSYIEIPCEMPYRFISSTGSLIMNNIYITNDLTQNGLNEYRNTLVSSWHNTYIYPNDTIFTFYFYWDIYSTTNSMIYNDRGQMIIKNMTIYGVGLHEQILHNTGIVYMDRLKLLRPHYYYDNSDLIHVQQFMYKVVLNEGAHYSLIDETCDDVCLDIENAVIMTNSEINGGLMGIHDQHGSVEVYNTLISNTMIAIHAYKSNLFKIEYSHLKNIGFYHSGDFIYLIISNSWWEDEHVYLYDVDNIMVEHNTFEYFPRNNYLTIYTEDTNANTMIEIKNNEFLNPVVLDNFTVDHFEDFSIIALYSYLIDYTLQDLLYLNPITNHLLSVKGYIKSSVFVGNIFHQNDIIESSLDTSCLYIDDYNWYTDDSFHCIAGNVFYGNGIHLDSGQISSCLHPDLALTYTDECWTEFGTLNNIEENNVYDSFIATHVNQSIFKIFNESHIILDHAIISTNFSVDNDSHNDVYHIFDATSVNGIISFLDVIMDESNHEMDIAFYEECSNACTQLYHNDIHQLHIDCINVSLPSELILLSDIVSNDTFIEHTTPTNMVLSSSTLFYPGGTLSIDFRIIDSNNNTIWDYRGEINIILTSTDFNFQTIIHIQYDSNLSIYQCDICNLGLYIQNVRMDESFGNQFLLKSQVKDNVFTINNVLINVTECPIGFGLNSISSQCYECDIGEISMQPSRSPCYSCNNDTLSGTECLGSHKLRVSRNYWVGINNVNIKLKNEYIVSQFCASNYCNQQHNALYLELSKSNKLCGINRDPNIPLCGQCVDGFSELFGSANCGKCDGDRYEFWILFVIIAAVITVLIVFMSATPSESSKKGIKSELMRFGSIALSKPILYYYQSVTFILLNSGIFVNMVGLAEIFNFQLDFGSNDNDDASGYCWIQGLTAKYEIMLQLVIPGFCMSALLLIFMIYKCIHCGTNVYFGKAFIKILLLIIGTICGVCFKLIACTQIGNDIFVHFYFGNDECYDAIWWCAMCILSFFVMLFCSFFIKLYLDHRNKLLRSDGYILQSFVLSYKIDKYWYWEMMMFSRRLIIALISITNNAILPGNTLIFFIAIFLLFQVFCKPFISDNINDLEFICLLCLLLLLHTSNDDYSMVLLNVLIIFPLIVFITQLIMIIYQENRKANIKQKQNSVTIEYDNVCNNELEISDNNESNKWNDIIPVGGRTVSLTVNNGEVESDTSNSNNSSKEHKMDIELMAKVKKQLSTAL